MSILSSIVRCMKGIISHQQKMWDDLQKVEEEAELMKKEKESAQGAENAEE